MTITVETREHLHLIAIDRADKRNAFDRATLVALAEAYTAFEDDPGARCAVLHARGDHFTAGLDLAEVGPHIAGGGEIFPPALVDPLDLFGRRRTKPVVCAVKGWCLTIGIELLLASDVRIAAAGTRFRQMEVNRGIMPFGGATARFPQIAGWGNAMRWLLTGDELDANEALRIGLICEIAEPAALLDRAVELAGRIARCAPLAVQATLASSRAALEQPAEVALATLLDTARGLMKTEDAAEGVRSFIERREARFSGR